MKTIKFILFWFLFSLVLHSIGVNNLTISGMVILAYISKEHNTINFKKAVLIALGGKKINKIFNPKKAKKINKKSNKTIVNHSKA